MKNLLYTAALLLVLVSCSVSYSFQGGSINYDKTKTITIQEFISRAPQAAPLLPQIFDEKLRNRFVGQTRLQPVSNNGDIQIEGEITGYNLQGVAVKEDAYSSETRLTITIRVRYTNSKEPEQDVDRSFSTSKQFPSTPDVPNDIIDEICDDIVDQIYNATVANW